MSPAPSPRVHDVAVVIPVYRGADTLPGVVGELLALTDCTKTPSGRAFRVAEVILVHDRGPDRSADVIGKLAEDGRVRAVWLARNSGQHAATVAGIASSASTWVVTMDEDGQHVPADIGSMVDAALQEQVYLVYGRAEGGAAHARWRNVTSAAAKRIARLVVGAEMSAFTSFRLIEGSRARAVCAYVGRRTFLDSALLWAIDRSVVCPTTRRSEGRPESGYNLGRLLSHFWTLVLSSGNRPLRIVSSIGAFMAAVGVLGAVIVVWQRLQPGYSDPPGWASVFVAQLLIGGLLLASIGVVAEYVGALLRIAQGQPLYIAVDDPAVDPLRWEHDD